MAPGHQHLRGRLERPGFLAAPALPPGSHRGPGPGRGAGHRQPFGVAVHGGKAASARADAGPHGAEIRPAAGVREPGGRQRRPDFRRPQRRLDAQGRPVRARAGASREDVVVVDLDARRRHRRRGRFRSPRPRSGTRWCWGCAITPARRASRKVLLGLSGGIDSALTAAIARRRPGPGERAGRDDAVALFEPGQRGRFRGAGAQPGHSHADLADCGHHEDLRRAAGGPAFRGFRQDVTEENIQSRIRGNLLMALSNKFGSLLLTTGNKSEMSVGYCTLYGDMNGGLAVIADLPKMMVYRVSRWRNRRRADIPEAILTKAPSAELRPGPDGPGQSAAVRAAGPDSGTARGAMPVGGGDRRAGVRRSDSAPRAAAGAHRGVQAEAGGAGTEGDLARVRHGMANADRAGGVRGGPDGSAGQHARYRGDLLLRQIPICAPESNPRLRANNGRARPAAAQGPFPDIRSRSEYFGSPRDFPRLYRASGPRRGNKRVNPGLYARLAWYSKPGRGLRQVHRLESS